VKLVALLALASCVPPAHDLRRPIDRDLAQKGLATTAQVDRLVRQPLTADAAIRIALANSPRLAAAFDDVGRASGDLALGALLGPTEVEVQLRGDETELDAIQPLLGLLEGDAIRGAARAEVAAASARAEAAAIRLAARVDIAFRDLLAAQQDVELRRTAFEAADAAATLRERMHDAGNTTDLAQARDRDAREQARLDVSRAEAEVAERRERINALLALIGDQTAWTTTAHVEELPAAEPDLRDLDAAAVRSSLELEGGRQETTAAADRLWGERVRSALPEVGAGVSAIDRDGRLDIGPALRIGLPIFDQRQGPRARAHADVSRAQHALVAADAETRARARAAAIGARAAYEEAARLRDVILPLRQKIVDETLAHYNAMDADPFQLIVARRELADAGHQYLDALRRFGDRMSEVTALRRGVSLEEP
jgi:cobalt-zinc-cadmium efflux system outer membrane protein